MNNKDDYKKYTLQAKSGIKGEAFFESLVSEYSLPIQVVGSKDKGIDYICQWVCEDKPTSILYAVQVKTFSAQTAKPKYNGIEKGFNNLEKYQINYNKLVIGNSTLGYWQTLGMPVYLFAICYDRDKINCYYKRFTPVLTQDDKKQSELSFYKVNHNNSFIAFADSQKKVGGFARDLFIDYIRCNYYNGSVIYLNPRDIGLRQFPNQEFAIFKDLFDIYRVKILRVYNQVKTFLDRYDQRNKQNLLKQEK